MQIGQLRRAQPDLCSGGALTGPSCCFYVPGLVLGQWPTTGVTFITVLCRAIGPDVLIRTAALRKETLKWVCRDQNIQQRFVYKFKFKDAVCLKINQIQNVQLTERTVSAQSTCWG